MTEFVETKLTRALKVARLNLEAVRMPPPNSRMVDIEEAYKILERAIVQEFPEVQTHKGGNNNE